MEQALKDPALYVGLAGIGTSLLIGNQLNTKINKNRDEAIGHIKNISSVIDNLSIVINSQKELIENLNNKIVKSEAINVKLQERIKKLEKKTQQDTQKNKKNKNSSEESASKSRDRRSKTKHKKSSESSEEIVSKKSKSKSAKKKQISSESDETSDYSVEDEEEFSSKTKRSVPESRKANNRHKNNDTIDADEVMNILENQ